MKKIITAGVTVMALTLAGCSNTNTSKNSTKTTVTKKANINTDKTVKINKTSTAYGPLKFKLKSIRYETVENKKSNYTDAEYNISGKLNKKYYRATLNLVLENSGTKPIDLSMGTRTYTVDSGIGFPIHGSTEGGALEEVISTLQPKSKINFPVYLISNNKFTANHLKISFDGLWGPKDMESIADSGSAEIK